MADLGVSFIPSGDDPQNAMQSGAAPSGVPPLQSAIKLLSLKLPRFGGSGLAPGALAPNALLNAPGSAGLPGGVPALEEVLRRLFGLGQPSAPPMGQPSAPPMGQPSAAPNAAPRSLPPPPVFRPGGEPPPIPPEPTPTVTQNRPQPTFSPGPGYTRPGLPAGGRAPYFQMP